MPSPRAPLLLGALLAVAALLLFLLTRADPSPRPGEGGEERTVPDSPAALAAIPRRAAPLGDGGPAHDASTPTVGDGSAAETPPATGPRALRVISDVGAPVAGAEIALLDDLPDTDARARHILARRPRAQGTTEADGTFLVAADAPRAGAVHVRATGFVEVIVALEPFPSEIRLVRARSLRVRVIDEHARPIAAATVRAVGTPRDVAMETDAEGRVELVADGTAWQQLAVWADGYVVGWKSLEPPEGVRDGPITVVLEEGRALTGRVVAAEDGRPLEGATVRRVWELEGRGVLATTPVTTAADGSFTVRVGSSPYGGASFHATAPDHLLGLASWNGFSFDSGPLVIRLERGRTIVGVVKDGAGGLVAGARVQALPTYWRATSATEGEPLTLAATDEQGRFQVRVPDAGSDMLWYVVARGPKGGWGSASVHGAGAGSPPLVVELEELGDLEGRVVTAEGVGAPGVRVRPTYPSGLEDWRVGQEAAPMGDSGATHPAVSTQVGSTVTKADGRFRLGPLPPGDLELILSRDGQPLGRGVAARVTAGGTTVVGPIVLDAGEVSGTVLDDAGRAVRGAVVHLSAQQPGLRAPLARTARTDDAGGFRFVAVPPKLEMSIYVTGAGFSFARLEKVMARPEPFEIRVTPLGRLVLSVTRDGRQYEGLLGVSWNGTLPPRPDGKHQLTFVSNEGSWVSCVAGEASMPLMPGFSLTVYARSVEAEAAVASAPAQWDPHDETTCRVSLDLRVPQPRGSTALPPGGR